MKRVLILGAGLVSSPMVKYLLEKGIEVIVASRTLSKAQALVEGSDNGKAIEWTVDKKDELDRMVKESDCTVSLLPYVYHVEVAEVCLRNGKPLVTTSYVSDEMQELESRARESDILLLNEIGLDPGIDHMSAKKTIDYINKKGGSVLAFHSYCGSLPAPENSDNPFRYKIGWSPKGVALAGRNRAKYLKDGQEVKVPPEDLFSHYFRMEIEDIGEMEIYPNRDSIQYLEKYGIEEANEIFRGTIRYPEWCDLWFAIYNSGLLDTGKKNLAGLTYREFVSEILDSGIENPEEAFLSCLDYTPPEHLIEKLEWLGLFSDSKIGIEKGACIDVLVERMNEKLSYREGEKDMVILQDEIAAEIDGEKKMFISQLTDFGTVGRDTAIARTVSLPAACAVYLVLENRIEVSGVHIPTSPEIYEPVLEELENVGIEMQEKEEKISGEYGLVSKDFNIQDI